MGKPRQLTPSCFAGGSIQFNLLPDPAVKQKQVEETVPVLDADGNPVMIQERNDRGDRLFLDENGNDTVNPTNADGTIQYEKKMSPQTTVQRTMVDDTWEDGSPRVTFGSMSYAPPILCKQTDANGTRVRYPGDPSEPISFSDADLTKEEIDVLQALFAGFMSRVAAEHSLHPSPAAADAAGA